MNHSTAPVHRRSGELRQSFLAHATALRRGRRSSIVNDDAIHNPSIAFGRVIHADRAANANAGLKLFLRNGSAALRYINDLLPVAIGYRAAFLLHHEGGAGNILGKGPTAGGGGRFGGGGGSLPVRRDERSGAQQATGKEK